MRETTAYVGAVPRVSTMDGMVHVTNADGGRPAIMPRWVALAYARALFASVADLEDQERASDPIPLPIRKRG
ncbi:hypothetical protein [Sphingomonas sp. LaA6.9]|uniref:hypothetical protein n=1 Tax=Sphingomonas sp. LaA6.9 TaxID=2919914 RepID=UPI001F503F56|nr:hypothetical protein [Sphingomonas sp. LaA6.9]MCJ8158837.1 hypothetical protein [Sphingomonas sp. LaA6.9]